MKKGKGKWLLPAAALALLGALLFFSSRLSPPAPTVLPAPTGGAQQLLSGERSELDQALLDRGVVSVRYTGESGIKLKVQITQPDGSNYNYDLNNAGAWETFPLTLGDGVYTVKLLEHIEGDRYTIRDTYPLELTLSDPTAPFLLPSQIVNYADGPVTDLAEQLTRSQTSEARKVAALFDYVVDHIAYDYDKSAAVAPGYLPDVEETLAEGKGICFDYAALLCAMVRSQGIPCRLVTGYAGEEKTYHAWVEVYCQDSAILDGAIPIAAGAWSRLDPTFVSSGGRSQSILNFVTDDGNYETVSLY